ncbi:hypothetical protein CEXT_608721 [Caerostris extrusa]|uniref:Uncharacterized protein n=1 Tax=Caerostris extrusa TaxID=172846 RepID=A0AAV4R423_CAEEX|nr:hypothetical protein CEXT_608721 [Caerostris extrusa]
MHSNASYMYLPIRKVLFGTWLLTSVELWEIFESRTGGRGRRNCSDFKLQNGCLQTGCGEIATDCLEHEYGNVLITIGAEFVPLSVSCLIKN